MLLYVADTIKIGNNKRKINSKGILNNIPMVNNTKIITKIVATKVPVMSVVPADIICPILPVQLIN